MKKTLLLFLVVFIALTMSSCEFSQNKNCGQVMFSLSDSSNLTRSLSTGEGEKEVPFSEVSQMIKLTPVTGTGFCTLSGATSDFVSWTNSSIGLGYGKWKVQARGVKNSNVYYQSDEISFTVGPLGVLLSGSEKWGTSISLVESYVCSTEPKIFVSDTIRIYNEAGNIVHLGLDSYTNFEIKWYTTDKASPCNFTTVNTLDDLLQTSTGFQLWEDPSSAIDASDITYVFAALVSKTSSLEPKTILGSSVLLLENLKSGLTYEIGSNGTGSVQFGKSSVLLSPFAEVEETYQDGKIYKVTYYDGNKNRVKQDFYNYSSSIKSVKFYNSDGYMSETYHYKFTDLENYIRRYTRVYSGGYTDYVEYGYNANNKKFGEWYYVNDKLQKEVQFYTDDGAIIYTYSYQYNEDGSEKSFKVYNGEEIEDNYVCTYDYDENGEVVPSVMLPQGSWWKAVNTKKSDITEIIFSTVPSTDVYESWSCDTEDKGTIRCYVEADGHTLCIFSAYVKANPDSSHMFGGFTNVVNIKMYDFDISDVQDVSFLFSDITSGSDFSDFVLSSCSKLESVSLYDADTSNLENMKGMLAGCSSLDYIDLTEFDTSKVTDMSGLFAYCSKLEEVEVSSKWKTSAVVKSNDMFTGCPKLPQSNQQLLMPQSSTKGGN